MSKQNHTPEPWHVGVRQADKIVYDKNGWAIANATVYHGKNSDEPDANARRIVACVNACAGIENPEAIAECIAALESMLYMVRERDYARPFGLVRKAEETLSKLKGQS